MNTEEQQVYIPIIMYHQVKYNNLSKDVISPYEFESDLKYYKDNNYNTITMTQLIDYVYNDVDLPPNPIILSFDDGYLSTYKNVFPLLKKYDAKIVLSIIGRSVDLFSKVVDNNIDYAHITWDQVSEMQQSGLVEIQNHSYNLHKICNGRYGCGQKSCESIVDYEKILEEDIMLLQDKIQAVINIAPNTFTYPYGKFSDTSEDILKNLGFMATISSTFGMNVIIKNAPDTLFGLKRICRAHNQFIDKLLKHGFATIKK
jgi:peptidoglycan/xylan/chitin deacetylase (PgdA/CDA1 family)